MFNKIKFELNSPDNKKLLSNFVSLSVLQVVGFILPLLVIPYLIKVLGIEKFGLVFFAQAFLSYFIVFTDYGFNLSATRDISIQRNNNKKVSLIFNSVISTKFLLGIISFIVLSLLILLIPMLRKEYMLFYLSFFLVIGQLFFPVWFFQGIEQMKFITYLSTTAKLLFTCLIFVFVRKSSDYILINVFQGMGNVLASIISILFIKKKFDIKLKFPGFQRIKFELKNGWHILVSSFAVNVYINSNIIILGFFTNSIVLGYYSLAEKTMLAIRQLLGVFSQVTYPHVCKLGKEGHNHLKRFYKIIYFPFLASIIICSILLYLFSDNLVTFLAHGHVPYISILVRLLCFAPIIVCLNIPAYQTLLAYNLKRSYSFVLTSGALFSMTLNAFLAYNYAAIGTSISILITETVITAGLYLVLEFKNKKYSLFYSKIKD